MNDIYNYTHTLTVSVGAKDVDRKGDVPQEFE